MPEAAVQHEAIVITGAGMITSLGLDRHTVWNAVRDGRCGAGPLPAMEQPLAPGKDGGQAPDLPADELPDESREVRYLRRTLLDALADAGLASNLHYAPERCGLMLGTTLHGMRAGGEYLRTNDFAPLRRLLAASVLRSATRDIPIEGFSATTCSACSSSLGAIALAVTMLREGKLDLVVAGGYDPISEYVYAGFNSLRLVAEGPLRPFARDRKGMKLAEGYGLVVLERAGDAQRRGATPIATVLGFGESADAHHLTQPHPQGDGAARAIAGALRASGLTPADIDLIVAHATGTPDNDAGEYAALSRVFGDDLPRVPVVGFKSHVGHTLGGAGAVELILAATAMAEQIVPPCANVLATDVEFPGLNVATGAARPARIRATLSTSLGFGGANTSMVLGPPPLAAATHPSPARFTSPREVFITGVGVVLPSAIGNDAFLKLLETLPGDSPLADSGPIPDNAIADLINARRVRRMSGYVKLTLAAAALAFRNAGITDVQEFCQTCSAILGSSHGCTQFSEQYYRQVVEQGINAGNPMLFAEGVPNAGAAHLSLMLSVKGACQTIIGSRTAGLDALALASLRIGQGDWDRAIVAGGEEYSPTVNACYRRCKAFAETSGDAAPGRRGFATGCGAVVLLLESKESLLARGGRAIGRLDASATAAPVRDVSRAAARVIRSLGEMDELWTSTTGMWLDRAEDAGIRLLAAEQPMPPTKSLYGKVLECFSAGPLACAAAFLLGEAGPAARSAGIICTDTTGLIAGVRLHKMAATAN